MGRRDASSRANEPDSRALRGTSGENAFSASAWWCGAVSSETELLSAAVLCAAIAANSRLNVADQDDNNPSPPTSAADRDAARRELEAFIRSSPLPHKLQLPVLQFHSKYILVESQSAVICAVRATSTSDIVEAVLGSTVPLAQPYVYRYGGARIHLPFWKRAQQLDMASLYSHARVRNKTLLLCGHSIAGSIAQIGLCELVYQQLPRALRQALEKQDADARKHDLQRNRTRTTSNAVAQHDLWNAFPMEEVVRVLPHVMAMGFGSPYISSHALHNYLDALGLTKRVVTLVNEFDCIPGILNVAQSAAMLTKTTERFLTITKATKTLFKLLPAQMQGVFVGMGAEKAVGTGIGSVTSAYITMSLNILQNTFHKFREMNVIKEIDFQYAPCGTYLFLSKDTKDYKLLSDASAVLRELQDNDAATTTLTGNSILQHLMSSYVDAIARRSTSIQINETMNYYERLGISRNATGRQIRTAYKNLALKWHPDRWSSTSNPREKDMAEQVFKLLAEAYEVLSDSEARTAYDAHLSKGLSWTEEFVRQGTVRGMTLDEAISTFRDVLDGATGAVSHVTSRFTSSSSSVVGQSRIRRVDPLLTNNNGLVPNNHQNLFAPDRIRVTRKVGLGAEQQEKVLFVQPDEILPGDVAAPAVPNEAGSGGAARAGLKSVSVLGGAVVVGASVALAVTAWNQYSDSSKRKMQAEAVRKMPGEYLLLLMDDQRSQRSKPEYSLEKIEKGRANAIANDSNSDESKTATNDNSTLAVRDQSGGALVVRSREEEEDDALADEFFECLTDYEDARLEAFAEDEFFDCVDLAEQVALHFKEASKFDTSADVFDNVFIAEEDRVTDEKEECFEFPIGSPVTTFFGLGTVESWRPGQSSAIIRFDSSCVGFIQKKCIERGASQALVSAKKAMEEKRMVLSERVVDRLGLEKRKDGHGILELVKASKDGALDSGIRAAGGVVIAKGISRASTTLGGAVAAPLTIASILVDIGKDYYEYRQKQIERKNLGVVSATSERLMMRDFRLKAGHHIASGAAAATGASLGAYSVASAVGFWTGVGITGPVGIVAATGAAIAGGMLGFFGGSKVYTSYTSSYFTSYNTAKEQIDRLELGARILFSEYDPSGTGQISKADCVTIITKLYEASGSVSESGYQSVLSVIQDDRFDGPVEWAMYWEWVSTEAARSLRELEEQDAAKNHESVDVDSESWWKSYTSYFSYANSALPALSQLVDAKPDAALYPSVSTLFKFGPMRSIDVLDKDQYEETKKVDRSELIILRAQMEYLVGAGALTESDAFQLDQSLESDDWDLRNSAKKTIEALHAGELDSVIPKEGGMISGGFFGDGGEGGEDTSTHKHSERPASTAARERTVSQEQIQMDVLCSLLSTDGLHHYLRTQHIEATAETSARHEDLHCLALQAAAPSLLSKK